jgi:amino acid permease
LFNCAVGAGIFALPNAFENIGIGLAVGMFLLMSYVSLNQTHFVLIDNLSTDVRPSTQ